MSARVLRTWLIAAALLGFAGVSPAQVYVSTPDDICPPATNPCVITEHLTVVSPGILDFGLRDVVVADGGRLRVEQAGITCGSFTVDGPELRTGIIFLTTEEVGSLMITAYRGCSLSPSTRCFEDAQCASQSLGTCTVGNGTIQLGAELEATRPLGPDIELRAAGDIVLGSDIIMRSTGTEANAGDLTVQSMTGDVRVNGPVSIRQADPQGRYYGQYRFPAGYPGEFTITARDIDIANEVHMDGADFGGDLNFYAGRDLRIRNNMSRNPLPGGTGQDGGDAHFNAGRDLIVEPQTDGDPTTISANGGSIFYHYDYYSVRGGGGGGNTWIDADNFVVQPKGGFQSNSPRDDCSDNVPRGGTFYIDSRHVSLDGFIQSRGSGQCGQGGYIYLDAREATVETHGSIDVSARFAGHARLRTSGNFDVSGTIDARGDASRYCSDGDCSRSGYGGDLYLRGDDINIGGGLLLGGTSYSADFDARACRIHVDPTGLIDSRCLVAGNCGSHSTGSFMAEETMTADAGSRILAEAGSSWDVYYYAGMPPELHGTFTPAPTLHPDATPPSQWSCPPCGNSRIETGESCDDGNIADGDGCSATCVNEYCVAQTPGYPAIGLCDDGSACTDDRCDPVANACVNEPGCADDFACTDEACVDDVCAVTAVDAACDDGNSCTTDICNTGTGCVHADLIGVVCDDNDICSQVSTCQEGTGCAPADPRPALGGRMKIDARADTPDTLIAKLIVPNDEVFAPVTETGARVRLVDHAGNALVDTTLPGALFTGQVPPKFDYRFVDPELSVAEAEGVTLLRVRRKLLHSIIDVRIKRPDLDAARTAALAGAFNLSVVLGPAPETDGCATLALASCRVTRKIVCRG